MELTVSTLTVLGLLFMLYQECRFLRNLQKWKERLTS